MLEFDFTIYSNRIENDCWMIWRKSKKSKINGQETIPNLWEWWIKTNSTKELLKLLVSTCCFLFLHAFLLPLQFFLSISWVVASVLPSNVARLYSNDILFPFKFICFRRLFYTLGSLFCTLSNRSIAFFCVWLSLFLLCLIFCRYMLSIYRSRSLCKLSQFYAL